jgi:hypothetical protein
MHGHMNVKVGVVIVCMRSMQGSRVIFRSLTHSSPGIFTVICDAQMPTDSARHELQFPLYSFVVYPFFLLYFRHKKDSLLLLQSSKHFAYIRFCSGKRLYVGPNVFMWDQTQGKICTVWPEFAVSNPAEAVGFFWCKNPQHAFLRRGNQIICPMSQIWGM